MDYKFIKNFISAAKKFKGNRITAIKFENGKATATDGSGFIYFEHKDIITDEEFYVQFADIVHAFSFLTKKDNVKITQDGFVCKSITHNFDIYNYRNFPQFNSKWIDDVNIGTFNVSELKDAMHFKADESTYSAIGSVYIDVVERKLLATDGRALYIKEFANNILPDIDSKFKPLFSKNVIQISNTLFGHVKLSISKENVKYGIIKDNIFTYVFRMEDGDFPNWKQVIPNEKFMKNFDIELHIGDKDCEYNFANNLATNVVTKEQTPIKYDGVEFNVSYNMLQKFMKVNQDNLTISITDNMNPCTLTTCDGVKVIFMPLRTK